MNRLRALVTWTRNPASSQSVRGPASWIATAFIVLLAPSRIAAPVLLARSRRPR